MKKGFISTLTMTCMQSGSFHKLPRLPVTLHGTHCASISQMLCEESVDGENNEFDSSAHVHCRFVFSSVPTHAM